MSNTDPGYPESPKYGGTQELIDESLFQTELSINLLLLHKTWLTDGVGGFMRRKAYGRVEDDTSVEVIQTQLLEGSQINAAHTPFSPYWIRTGRAYPGGVIENTDYRWNPQGLSHKYRVQETYIDTDGEVQQTPLVRGFFTDEDIEEIRWLVSEVDRQERHRDSRNVDLELAAIVLRTAAGHPQVQKLMESSQRLIDGENMNIYEYRKQHEAAARAIQIEYGLSGSQLTQLFEIASEISRKGFNDGQA